MTAKQEFEKWWSTINNGAGTQDRDAKFPLVKSLAESTFTIAYEIGRKSGIDSGVTALNEEGGLWKKIEKAYCHALSKLA